MDPRTARRIAAAALVLGVLANLLFDGAALGINLPLGVAAGLVGLALFGRGPVDRADLWLPLVAIAAAIPPVIWTDPTVAFLDLVLVAVALGAWALAAGGVPVTRRATAEILGLGAWAAVAASIGAAHLLRWLDQDGELGHRARALGRGLPILRGLAVAGPVVVVFAFLLASADAVFSRGLEYASDLVVDPFDPLRRALYALLVAWPVAGLLALAGRLEERTLLPPPVRAGHPPAPPAGARREPPGAALLTLPPGS